MQIEWNINKLSMFSDDGNLINAGFDTEEEEKEDDHEDENDDDDDDLQL